ncbi:MAG: general secretion pathway protein J [Halieaceae bacterium]|jgi:general secretion pathway protein J
MITLRRSAGFTLVEMMVSMAILSMIMLATVTGLRTLANTQASLAVLTDRNDELRAVSTFLRDALESAVVGNDISGLSRGGGVAERTVFESRPESLVWKTTMLFGESAGGSYLVRVGSEEGQLVMRWQKTDPRGQSAPWNNVASRTLVQNIQSFAVAYRRSAGGAWQSAWDGSGAPGWVRLRVQANERYWPDMVMEVAR